MKSKEKKKVENNGRKRPERVKLSPEESLKRMEDFPKRKEKFIAAIREDKD
jgi:hypothetical protein